MYILSTIVSIIGASLLALVLIGTAYDQVQYRAYRYKHPNPKMGWDNKE